MVDNGHGLGFCGVDLQLEESDINVVNNRLNKDSKKMKIKYFEAVKKINEVVPVFVNRNCKRKVQAYYNIHKNEIHVPYNKRKKSQSLESLIHEFSHFLTIPCLPKTEPVLDVNTGLKYYEIYESIAEMVTIEVSQALKMKYTYEGYYMELIGVDKYKQYYNKFEEFIKATAIEIIEIIK
jgi:hypothetical protein